jgi:hypothetical protein
MAPDAAAETPRNDLRVKADEISFPDKAASCTEGAYLIPLRLHQFV